MEPPPNREGLVALQILPVRDRARLGATEAARTTASKSRRSASRAKRCMRSAHGLRPDPLALGELAKRVGHVPRAVSTVDHELGAG